MILGPFITPTFKSSSGFSLINLMVGLGLLSVITMTAAYITLQTKKSGAQGEFIYHLNQDHILALQMSKSMTAMKLALGITPTSHIGQCMAGRGTGCNGLNVQAWMPIPGMASSKLEPGGRTIATAGTYKLECATAASCEALVIKVESTLTSAPPASTAIYKRQSEVRLGGIFLSDRREIDFSCASATGNLMTAMNMQTLRGECLPLPTSAPCPSRRPLTAYHVGGTPDCQPSTVLSCPTGFRSVGILSGQAGCI